MAPVRLSDTTTGSASCVTLFSRAEVTLMPGMNRPQVTSTKVMSRAWTLAVTRYLPAGTTFSATTAFCPESTISVSVWVAHSVDVPAGPGTPGGPATPGGPCGPAAPV